jgi:aflatoxin B1 aldehyde reductase
MLTHRCFSGGLLNGNIKSKDAPLEKGARFDPESDVGKVMRRMFLSGTELEAYQYLESVIVSHRHPYQSFTNHSSPIFQKKHNLTGGEVALRWLQHHSALTPNDYVIIGGSKAEHVVSNCSYSAKGPLPDEVVEAAETTWLMAKARAQTYFLPFNW